MNGLLCVFSTMKCPRCHKDCISHSQIFRSSRLFKARCSQCGVKFYCDGLVELTAHIASYCAALVLSVMAFLYQSVFYLLAVGLVFIVYEMIKIKFSKWVVVSAKNIP